MVDKNNRIKFVETSGQKYLDFYLNSNAFSKNCEPEEKCLGCDSSKEGHDCKTLNVSYSLQCALCKANSVEKSHKGEAGT